MTRIEKLRRAVKEGNLEVIYGHLNDARGWVEVQSTQTGKRTVVNKESENK